MWHKITVEQYQQIARVQAEPLEDMDKLIAVIGIIYDKTESQVNDLPVPLFHRLTAEVNELFSKGLQTNIPGKYIKANGHKYRMIYKAAKITYGQWTEIMHFLNGDLIQNLHLLAASIAGPVKYGITHKNNSDQHEAVATDFLQANFAQTYNAVVFFCLTLTNLEKAMPDFLESPSQMIQDLRKQLNPENQTDSQKDTDGYTVQRRSETMKVPV
jgi:hypothetical protein